MKAKYIKSIIAAIFAIVSIPSLAESFEEGGLWYEIDANNNGNVIVTKAPSGYSYSKTSYNIPEIITRQGISYTVVAIGDYAFSGLDIESISLPNSVIAIGDNAFYFCSKLIALNLSASLEEIGRFAFANCNKLASVLLPASLEKIGSSAFQGCSSLTEIIIPKSVTDIDSNPFISCKGLSSLRVEEGNKVFDSRNNCNAIIRSESLIAGCLNTTIPEGITAIGGNAFYGLDIESISLPNSVITIGDNAFYFCSKLITLQLSASLEEIGRFAFANCNKLASVLLPASLEKIGSSAFQNCSSLKEIKSFVTTPQDVNENAFYSIAEKVVLYVPIGSADIYKKKTGWKSIENIVEFDPYRFEVDGIYYKVDESNPDNVSVTSGDIKYSGSVTIPSSVTYMDKTMTVTAIGNNAFINCIELESVLLPITITHIGKYAFYGCNSLTSINLPAKIRKIDEFAFCCCNKLSSILLPEFLETIECGAFYGCSSLTEITIPKSVIYISSLYPFGACKLSSLKVEEGNAIYDSRNNCNAILKGDSLIVGSLTTIIPDDITIVGNWAFRHLDIDKIFIPNSVTRIGYNAFENCSNLTDVGFSFSITEIGSSAFNGCSKLSSILLPPSLKEIGMFAFLGCNHLSEVKSFITTPNDISDVFVNIADNATLYIPLNTTSEYQKYENWTKNFKEIKEFDPYRFEADGIYYLIDKSNPDVVSVTSGEIKYSGSVTIPSSVTYMDKTMTVTAIGEKAFFDCKELTSVSLPSTITKIGEHAFQQCLNLTTINVPPSVIEICEDAFANCLRITKLKLPNSLTTIGRFAFWNTGISSITIPKSVKSIGIAAVGACPYLVSIQVEDGNDTYDSRGNSNAIFSGTSLIAGCLTTVIPEGITTLESWSFAHCDFSSINLPSSITKIVDAFISCSHLTSIELPASLMEIGSRTFESCDSLESITAQMINPIELSEGTFNHLYDKATLFVPKESIDNYKKKPGWKDFKTILAIPDDPTIKINGIIYAINIKKGAARVAGVDSIDYVTIESAIEYEGEQYVVNEVCDSAFAGKDIVSVLLPKEITTIGSGVFHNCHSLSAIDWQITQKPSTELVQDITNLNLLFYVTAKNYQPDNIRNIIVGGVASLITLTDANPGNFYCPKAFTAERITYTHRYSLKTEKGVSEGWEAIALPFDVTGYTTEQGNAIKPYASAQSGERLFWLKELTNEGMRDATGIKANIPYLISMPNWEGYQDYYNITGDVTFSAEDVEVPVTSIVPVSWQGRHFTPCFQRLTNYYSYAAINKEFKVEGTYPPGSIFICDHRDILPFEAYIKYDTSSAVKYISIAELCGNATAIQELPLQQEGFHVENGTIYMESLTNSICRVYSLSGQLVKQMTLKKGVNQIHDLNKGLYIINGKKTIIK